MEDIKYFADGTQVVVLSENPTIVQEMVEVYSGDEIYVERGRIFQANRPLYDTPPTAVLDAECDWRNREIEKKRAELNTLEKCIASAQRDRAAQIEKYAAQDAVLANLAEVLDGNITHLVFTSKQNYKVVAIADLAAEMETREYDGKRGLLCLTLQQRYSKPGWWLFGNKTSGDYLSEYGVIPCSSEEQAVAIAKQKIAEAAQGEISYRADNLLESMRRFEMDTTDYERRLKEKKAAQLQSEIARRTEEIKSLQSDIDALGL